MAVCLWRLSRVSCVKMDAMTFLPKTQPLLAGVALICGAASSLALTLGPVSGVALVGRPLDLNVQVKFQADEDVSSSCFDAEVFYADSRQDPSRVKVSFTPGAAANSANVRVVSSTLIDEPVVAVNLRAGCSQKTSRRYVVLADFPSETALPGLSVGPSTKAVLPVELPQSRTPVDNQKPLAAVPAARPVERRVPMTGVRTKPMPPPVLAEKKPAGKPRLQLDAFEPSNGEDPILKSSPELLTAPTDSVERRAEATAWWLALNRSAQDVLRDSAKTQGLEENLVTLRTLAAKNQGNQTALINQLQQVESQRYSSSLVYGLIGLLALTLGGAVYLWLRQRRQLAHSQDWWRESQMAGEFQVPTQATPERFDSTYVPALPGGKTSAVPPTYADVDIELNSLLASIDAPLQPPTIPAAMPGQRTVERDSALPAQGRDFGHSIAGSLLTSNTQELFDTRQQADFFVALGQHDKAVEVLERCIHGGGESSPMVYMDLLKLLHQMNRKGDYQNLRRHFSMLFSAHTADFAAMNAELNALEA
jgi:hypothetical protein